MNHLVFMACCRLRTRNVSLGLDKTFLSYLTVKLVNAEQGMRDYDEALDRKPAPGCEYFEVDTRDSGVTLDNAVAGMGNENDDDKEEGWLVSDIQWI